VKITGIYHVKVKITLENPRPLLAGPLPVAGARREMSVTSQIIRLIALSHRMRIVV